MKTRKAKKSSSSSIQEIQHHHLLLRLELERSPNENQKPQAIQLIHNIVRDIEMKLLATPKVYYVVHPEYNAGLTAIAPIETSHIAFHFWSQPKQKLLHNIHSKSLLQFDVYTCGTLTISQIKKILHHLTAYGPTHADITLLNRNLGMTFERHMKWDSADGANWNSWLESERFNAV